jgi:hypothetical protein
MIPDNACSPRITAAAGTELAGAFSGGNVRQWTCCFHCCSFPLTEVYNPKGLHPSRGVAPSGFRPLGKILDCCLPKESGPYLNPSVAGHPLRPATHRSLGGPLPRQLANGARANLQAAGPEGSPPLIKLSGTAGPHAVLAQLSLSYPPLGGMLPTCYSPVRHSQEKQLLASPSRSTCMPYPRRQRSS